MAKYTTTAETDLLRKYASQAKLGIVEIGVLDGETTKQISMVSSCPIYGIDPIIPDSMDPNLIGSEQKIVENMAHYPEFHFYKDYSYNVSKSFYHDFDLLFIDGDHRYESVKKDFICWGDLLESGGYVAFHDSDKVDSIEPGFTGFMGHEGCIKFVKELKNSWYLKKTDFVWIERVDTINVFKKK